MRMKARSLRLEAGSQKELRRAAQLLAASVGLALIASCGGGGDGGGGGGGGTNRAPVLGATAFSTNEDTDLSGSVSATDADGDTLTYTRTSEPTQGAITEFNTSTGAFVYRPNANASGNDSFTVRITDGRGLSINSTIAISVAAVNDTPVAANDVMDVNGAQLANINVRANDSDAEGEALTLTIEQPAVIGTAAANSDGSVRIDNLPAGFKGVTRFKYRVTDPSGAFSVATAAVFVGTLPFRVAFIGDEAANGSPEVFMTDFVATFRVSSATEGNLRLRGFAVADNGSTVAYRREDTSAPANTDFSYVRTQATNNQVRVTLPSGYTLALNPAGDDQFTVSPDGNWIALIASTATPTAKSGAFLLNVSDPASIRSVAPSGVSAYAELPRFSRDSAYLYFLGSDNPNGTKRNLYRVAANSTASSTLVSAAASAPSDDMSDYFVSADQSRVTLVANRNGKIGLHMVNLTTPVGEVQISRGLDFLENIQPATITASPDGLRMAYTTLNVLAVKTFLSEVSSSPNAREIAPPGSRALAFTPTTATGQTLLYTRSAGLPSVDQVFETVIDVGSPDTLVGEGVGATYDSSGDTVIVRQQVGTGADALNAAYRGSFNGTTQPLNTAGKAARYFELSGAPRGTVIVGEGPTTGGVPATLQLALINARAPRVLLNLGNFPSPTTNVTSGIATVVTY